MDILNRIFSLIEQRRLTKQAVLKEFGYDKSFFSDWKAGKIKNPPVDKIVKFAEYFGVTTDYLLGLSEEKTNEVKNEKEKEMSNSISQELKDKIFSLIDYFFEVESLENKELSYIYGNMSRKTKLDVHILKGFKDRKKIPTYYQLSNFSIYMQRYESITGSNTLSAKEKEYKENKQKYGEVLSELIKCDYFFEADSKISNETTSETEDGSAV